MFPPAFFSSLHMHPDELANECARQQMHEYAHAQVVCGLDLKFCSEGCRCVLMHSLLTLQGALGILCLPCACLVLALCLPLAVCTFVSLDVRVRAPIPLFEKNTRCVAWRRV